MIKVNFFSTFREKAGVTSINLDLQEGCTIHQLIFLILDKLPSLRQVWLDKSGELHGHVHIGLNQVDVMALPEGMNTVCKDNDVIDFFPPITGG